MKKVTLEPEEYLIGGIDPYDFTVEQIGNSKLYLKQVPWSTCVYVRLVFNVGAIHDPVGKEGFQVHLRIRINFKLLSFQKNIR
jgi:hypothetical protein